MEGEDDVFEIERILENSVEKGVQYYRVRWKGFGEDEDTWEPEKNLFDCKNVLEQYWKKKKKNKKPKVEKCKSESTPLLQTSKAKKKKCGRTTNNSTIARIDSSSSQDENILLPNANKQTSSLKVSKTKRKRGSDKDICLKKNNTVDNTSDNTLENESSSKETTVNFLLPNANKQTSSLKVSKTKRKRGSDKDICLKKNNTVDNTSGNTLENESSSKTKETTVKKKKRKKQINKDLSVKSQLEQPHETKQTLDENKNTTKTNQTLTLPDEKHPVITIEDTLPENSTKTKDVSTLQRESSRESLSNKSVGRRSWSYEGSPEYVPEYCDETLAYDMCSEEEYEYFGETGYFVKDSVGYEKSNYFKPTERPATDESLIKDESHVEDYEQHVKDEVEIVEDDEDRVTGTDEKENVKDKKDHVKDDKDHVKDDKDHVKDDKDYVKDDEFHVNYNEKHVKGDEDHVKGNEGHVKGDEGHVKGDEDHVKGDKHRVKDGGGHVKDDNYQIKDVDDNLEDDEGHVKDYDCHVNNEENNEAITSVEQPRIEEQKRGDTTCSIPEVEHQLSNSTSRDAGHDLQHQEECVQFSDKHIDTLISEGSTASQLDMEESVVSKALQNDDIVFNKRLSDDMKTNLKLNIRSSSSGDSLTDGECLSPEFGKLPEPRKGYFDRVFTESIGDEKETTTPEVGNNEHELTKRNDFKEEPGNTGTQEMQENFPCHDPKSDAEEGSIKSGKIIVDVVKNSDVTSAEQSVGNASTHEKLLHGDTKSEEQPQIQDAYGSEKSNIIEIKDEIGSESEKSNTQDILLDISQTTQSKPEKISNIDDQETSTKTSACSIDKEKKLSEEETAHCLLDLSNVIIGLTSKNKTDKISVQLSNEETHSHMKHSDVPDVDLNKSSKLGSSEEISNIKGPHTSSTKNENLKGTNEQLILKRKADENNSQKFWKKSKIRLNLPFIEQSSGEMLNILDDAVQCSQASETDIKGKCLSPNNTLMTDRKDITASKSAKNFRTKVETTFTGSLPLQESSSERKSNDILKNVIKSSVTATDQGRASLTHKIVPTKSQIKHVSVTKETNTFDSSSSVKATATFSDSFEQKSKTPSSGEPASTPVLLALSAFASPAPVPFTLAPLTPALPSPTPSKPTPPAPAPPKLAAPVLPTTTSVLPAPVSQAVTPPESVKEAATPPASLPKQEIVQQTTAGPAPEKNKTHPKEHLSSLNTSEKKPEMIVGGKIEVKNTSKKITDCSNVQNNKSDLVSFQQSVTTTDEVGSVNDKKDLRPQYTQITEGPSTTVSSSGRGITQVYGRGRYEGSDHVSWSGDQTKTYPYSVQYGPSAINQNLYSDLPSANPFIVSHLNQKGFSVPPSHVNQQPTQSQVNPKPFSAVAGINWYPENQAQLVPKQTRLIGMAPRPLYFVPAFPMSSQYSQPVFHNNMYARALQEMAKRRQPESQSVNSTFSNNVYSSSIDADRAWYAKHVGNTSIVNSSQTITERNISSSGPDELKGPSGASLSNNITVNISSEAPSTSEKMDTKAPYVTVETKKGDLIVSSQSGSCVATKSSSTGEECAESKNVDQKISDEASIGHSEPMSDLDKRTSNETTSMLSQSRASSLSNADNTTKSKSKAVDKDKGESKVKGKDKNKLTANSEYDKRSLSFSKQSLVKDSKNTNQKSTNVKLENRSSSSRSGSKEDKKEKRNDSEKLRAKDKDIPRKREDLSKTHSRSKKDEHRTKYTSKGKELKKQESVDSEVEFDFDDHNPWEMFVQKVEKMHVSHTGIPTAMSLREVKSAIKQGDAATVLASLAGGMNIDSQDSVSGMTLLMRAVTFGQENIVKLLLNHGANINIKDNTGSTPLIAACEQGFENIVSHLLNAEIDINAKQTLSGETALIKACVKGHYSVVAMLLAHGADCQMRSVSGLTAAQLAAQSGYFEIRDMLESHSKKLQRCVETAIASCLCDSSKLMYPPLLPFVSLYPSEGQKFTYHFHCGNSLLTKTILLFCLHAVFSRSGQVDLSFSKDNGVHTVLLNGSLQSPVLSNNKSVFVLQPKLDTNRLILQTYQSHVHLLVCIYATELDESILNIEPSPMKT